ncbi:hypothetical protein HPP92_024570 [Vanilla planifolia]|uniref:Uncharacterized protein n=1 Tax=Vanilla planifolia TaxID=51239 RepID=A0A835PSH0_VANPL|nr:hypothetical protein HPP92_024570 [Vanilla planifolia]
MGGESITSKLPRQTSKASSGMLSAFSNFSPTIRSKSEPSEIENDDAPTDGDVRLAEGLEYNIENPELARRRESASWLFGGVDTGLPTLELPPLPSGAVS